MAFNIIINSRIRSGVDAWRIGQKMIITIDPEVVIRIIRRIIRVPITRHHKLRIQINITFTLPTAFNITVS